MACRTITAIDHQFQWFKVSRSDVAHQMIDIDITDGNLLIAATLRCIHRCKVVFFRQTLDIAQREQDASLPEVRLGRFYCNDQPGQRWSVRQIIDERRSDNPDFDLVIYKVVDGNGLNRTGSCTRNEFARWVGSELQPRGRKG